MTEYRCRKTEGALCIHEACRPQGPISEELKAQAADVLPRYQASLRFGPAAGPREAPYEITVSGTAAFVARVAGSVADAFEEDAQR